MKADTSTNDIEDINIENPFKNFSFFNYIYEETTTPEVERESSIYKNRKKRIYTFLSIPINLESFLFYALIICFDHFLWLYTFLPVRCFLVPYKWCKRIVSGGKETWFHIEEIEDCVKLSIMFLVTFIVCYLDTSVIYHQIRSQSVIKLYIFYNLLEVADRLLSPLSQDITDALSWTIGKTEKRRQHFCAFVGQYVFAVCCFLIHLIVMVSQTTILSVAFNSHNYALLTVMLSNNFVELKGNVFRKVEKTNLFQMSCADSRERFHYFIMLSLVVLRNLTETGWNTDDVWSMFMLSSAIMFTEVLVDWVKHAFVSKFNFITADVYKEFSVSLAYDLLLCRVGKNTSSHFELFGRRMGLTSIPLVCLVNIFVLKSFRNWLEGYWLLLLIFSCFVMKVFTNLLLISRSYSKVNSYVTAAKIRDHAASNKDSSMSDAMFKLNDYDIVLPPLYLRRQNSFSALKRTLSFSEGLTNASGDKLTDEISSTKQARSARSSFIVMDSNTSLDFEELYDTVEFEGLPLSPADVEDMHTICGDSPATAIEELSNESSDDSRVIARKRYRTISNITEDLSDGGAEPLIIRNEEASGVTSDINDGSKGLFMTTPIDGATGGEEDGAKTPVDGLEGESRHPFGDVDRFSMYNNQIV